MPAFAGRTLPNLGLKEGEATLRRELDRFVSLIATGQAPARVLEEITAREQQIRTLELERERLQAAAPKAADLDRIRTLAQTRMRQLRETLHRDVPGARAALRLLLEGPITFTLQGSDYRLEGKTRVGALLDPDAASVTRIGLASPRGYGLIPQLLLSSPVSGLGPVTVRAPPG